MDTRQGLAEQVKAVRRFTRTTTTGAPARFGRARPRKRLAEAVRRVTTSTPTGRFSR